MTLAILFGCTEKPLEMVDSQEEAVAVPEEDASSEPGIGIVEFDDDMLALIEDDLSAGKVATRSMALNSAMDELGIVSMTRLFPDAGEYEGSQRRSGLHRFYKVEFDENVSLTRAVSTLEGVRGIRSVERKHRIEPRIFNDPYLSNQWHYINDGSNGMKLGVDVNVLSVWEQMTTGSSKVIVGVIDGGIEQDHPDLAANLIPGGKDGSKNFITGSYVITGHTHGTHVGGTISAVNNNGIGVCGIAGGDAAKKIDGVRLLSCQIFEEGSERSGDGAAAIVWAAQHGAVISQNSWGYSADSNRDGKLSPEEIADFKSMSIPGSLRSAIDYFIKYAGCDDDGNQLPDSPMKGGVVIFAAGNDGLDYDPIGVYPPVIAVGAIDSKGYKASFSNYGDWVDICAPGVKIYSTDIRKGYTTLQGTSMACPHVSGVAALVVSYLGGQGFTAQALTDKLIGGSNKDIISQNAEVGGLVDAMGAMAFGGSNIPARVSAYSVSSLSNNVDFSWKLTGTKRGIKAYGYLLMASKSREALENVDPKSPSQDVITAFVKTPDEVAIGAAMEGRLPALEFDTEYYVSIAGCDYASNFSAIADIKTIRTQGNKAPVIKGDNQKITLRAFEEVRVPVVVEEPDGHDYTVNLDGGSDAVALGDKTDADPGSYNLVISGRKAPAGKYTLTFSAKDSYGLSSEWKLDYEILENNVPVLVKPFDNILATDIGTVYTFNSAEYFSDADGEPLKFIVQNSDGTIAHLNSAGDKFYLTTLSYGVTTIEVTATDALDKSVSSSFKVLVRDADVNFLAYPNPVVDVLHIATGKELETVHVRILSSTGAVVLDKDVQASAFEAAEIDLGTVAPGRYTMILTFGAKEYRQTIIKK